MTKQELHEHVATRTGDDIETIERLGFEIHVVPGEPDSKGLKRLRRLKQWREQRRNRHLAKIQS